MEEALETSTMSAARQDDLIDRDGTKRWAPKKPDSLWTITLKEPGKPDTVELTPQQPEAGQTTTVSPPVQGQTTPVPKGGNKTLQNLDKMRFTVTFRKPGSTTFESYPPGSVNGKPEVSLKKCSPKLI